MADTSQRTPAHEKAPHAEQDQNLDLELVQDTLQVSDGPDEATSSDSESGPQVSVVVENSEEQQAPALPYPVVAMGASAGGLQAFVSLFENLPEDTGMAFAVISHLAPDQPSFMPEILSRHTEMPVQAMHSGQKMEPNHVYVLPPNQVAQLRHGVIHLHERQRLRERHHLPIDAFFYSIAADQRNHAIGVVLSGADSDGALGLKAIKGEGGIALVQSPETAQQGSMPLSSIAADHVDLIVPPAQLGIELARLAHQFFRPEVRSLETGEAPPTDEQSYNRILQLLRSQSGLELRQYKPETIRRRIARRMILLRIETLAEYLRFLQIRTDELRVLQEDVLISVTRFFRDPDFWLSLSTNILPTFFQNRSPEKPVRIWCAGCSTGEEAYSLAITLLEYLTSHGMDTAVQIFGTDASEHSIEQARTAIYPETLAAEISPERLRRFFTKVDSGYQVSKRVRDCCIFARQNLCIDPPFSHIDFLSCRNVMIYFNQTLQKQVMSTFHYALEPDGYMLLGMSESLRDYTDLFNAVDRKYKIYSKVGGSSQRPYSLTQAFSVTNISMGMRESIGSFMNEGWTELELQRAADRIVLARYGPPGLIVDDRLNVLQARGQTAPFVELASGAVSWNLSRVLREDISAEVKVATERSIQENIPVSSTIPMRSEEGTEMLLQLDVLPITSATARTRCFLILFSTPEAKSKSEAFHQAALPVLSIDDKEKLIAQLRQDLTSTRFHLQSLIEERDARNQELVSANEEIQSANEELQSTNEELETTKEELQSANEELQTVNEELQQRNAVLTQTGNDLTNLLTSVNMPLLMLTENLHIRQFTPPMERLLNVRASDIGRSISELRLQLSIDDIEPILLDVLDTLGTREVEVQDREGRWYLLRVRPYRTTDNKIEGLVVLLVDIDQLRSSQQELREARDFANTVVQSVPVPVVVLKADCTVRSVNNSFRELTQMKDSDLIGRSFPDLANLFWGVNGLTEQLHELAKSAAGTAIELEHESTTAQRKTISIKAQALSTDGDRILLLTLEDVTLHKEAERALNQQQEALQNEVEVTGKTLLQAREQLSELAAHLFSVQEEERQYVARELHDDISQRLSALEILCDTWRGRTNNPEEKRDLASLHDQLHALNDDIRTISHRLHPSILNHLGLAAAVRALVDDFREREKMPATFAESDIPEKLDQVISTSLYRITQEALRNVGKHAGPTHVKVMLTGEDHTIRLSVRDFGIGFDQESEYPLHGLGLISMKERARIAGGSFEILSSLGEGVSITVTVPNGAHLAKNPNSDR
ncbi:CheR family methyltransferase [Terriglobus albidus]|uniref:CheR family methyltransferase n=1 Tax=Terriglobus albidus TaxID=1592106 RepID=UPI0021E01C79|nr:CheR family methyltransferase [Terriglobus albidus]